MIANEVRIYLFPALRSIMVEEKPQFELIRLRKEQNKARHDEVFGGLSPAERAAYNRKSGRIHELQIDFQVSAFTKKSLWSAKSEQSRQWN
jgi:hypothetical protein